jgi:hypothetical protein
MCLPFWLLPLLVYLPFWNIYWGFKSPLGKMSIFMADLAFEGEFFIIYLL